jgi:putative adhesin
MSTSLDHTQPSPAKRFWRTWRREIVRGGVLFGLVVGAGFFIRSIKIHVPTLPDLSSLGDFNWDGDNGGDQFGAGRHVGETWNYMALLKPSQHLWIRNTIGPIDVVAGTSDSVVIRAEKSWNASDPQLVQIIPVPTERGLTVCAVWQAKDSRCNDGGDYHLSGLMRNDIAVRFTVQLPRNIAIDVSTQNGGLQVEGASAPVTAATVNGRIAVRTTTGPVNAQTINGSIEAVMQSLLNGDVRLKTVNGSVSAGLPRDINANIDAETVTGRVETDFPVRVSGKISPRHLHGTIGNGGATLTLTTVNGSITLHDAGAYPSPGAAPHAPSGPHAPRHRVRTPPPQQP